MIKLRYVWAIAGTFLGAALGIVLAYVAEIASVIPMFFIFGDSQWPMKGLYMVLGTMVLAVALFSMRRGYQHGRRIEQTASGTSGKKDIGKAWIALILGLLAATGMGWSIYHRIDAYHKVFEFKA